ncbi:FmdB family zinc ribbon protein [Pseudonocardia sp. GCM10023141]|uniref:FmdB family zinc ribbon protein n=1 Tax=Pseudonocardia sp. GCM10023141 TaxID=3252653 RepID=UPI003615C8C5
MATYRYRCDNDGPVDIRRPIGTAPVTIDCPDCGAASVRVITAPMLGLADRRRMAVIDHAAASSSEPAVVSSIPQAPRAGQRQAHRPQLDPRMSKLPRA